MSKTIVITGATSGIGKATALLLAQQGHTLWLLNRSSTKTDELIAEIRQTAPSAQLHFVQLDLTRLSTVYAAAERLLQLDRIDVLINNAGGLTAKREVTADGFETQFQMNHLGHFALTTALLPLLEKSKARILNVSSEAHRAGRIDFNNLQSEKNYSSFQMYANVKLMNALFTRELHKRYSSRGIKAFALHPGVVNTRFGDGLGKNRWMWKLMSPFLITPEKGAATSVFLATADVDALSGNYFKNAKLHHFAKAARSDASATSLWEQSEKLLSH